MPTAKNRPHYWQHLQLEKLNRKRTLTFQEFEEGLARVMNAPLPGAKAHQLMVPAGREQPDLDKLDESLVKKAGVMLLFYEHDHTPNLVLTLRVKYKGVHSGQISFPGGKREEGDKSFLDTALRETEEEIGTDSDKIKIYGALTPLYIPPSNFLVYPFVGIYKAQPQFIRQKNEVEEILNVDFNHFLKDAAIVEKVINVGGFPMDVPAFLVAGHIIWGATAMMLSELRQMLLKNAGTAFFY